MHRCLVVGLGALLAACIEIPGPACADEDVDGDGWNRCGEPADCNDADSEVHPGARDELADAIDQDCSGADLTEPLAGVDLDENGTVLLDDRFGIDTYGSFSSAFPIDLREEQNALSLLSFVNEDERGAGLAIAPEFTTATAGSRPEPTKTQRRGVRVEIDAPFFDSRGEGAMHFMAYPNGRIVRYDDHFKSWQIRSGSYSVTSYTSLFPGVFTHASWNDEPEVVIDPEQATTSVLYAPASEPADGYLCARADGLGIAVVMSWKPLDRPGPRVTSGEGRLSFEYDWYRDTDVPSFDLDLFTAFALVEGGCDDGVAVLENWRHPVPIKATLPGTWLEGADGDVEGDGFSEGTGAYVVDGHDRSVRFYADGDTTDVAVVARIEGNPEVGVSVSRDGVRQIRDVDYLEHVEASDLAGHIDVYLWFPGEVTHGTSFIVASPMP